MFIVDENVSQLQVLLLRKRGVRVRLIGEDVADIGTEDENLLPVLRTLKAPVLFTQDEDFFRFDRWHAAYGLAWLDVRPSSVADYIGRFLRHPHFDVQSKRLGVVARVHAGGVQFWRGANRRLQFVSWPEE